MIPLWLMNMPLDLIHEEALKHKIEPELVASIVQMESGGETCATRFEPNWKYIYSPFEYAKALGITQQTEENHQMTSWGLMQVMGTVARELGFKGYLPELCEAKVGIKYGCLKLKELFIEHGSKEDVISAYNQGSPRKTSGGMYLNERYVDEVMKYYRELKN